MELSCVDMTLAALDDSRWGVGERTPQGMRSGTQVSGGHHTPCFLHQQKRMYALEKLTVLQCPSALLAIAIIVNPV